MAEEQTGQIGIQKIYVKDVSFESPNAPAVFNEDAQQQLQMGMNQRVQQAGENLYEVVLTVTVTSKVGEQTAYLVEVQQAGIFQLVATDESQLNAVLGGFCPQVLFPYARQIIMNLVGQGGFMPIVLQHVDFNEMLRQRMAEQQQGDAAPSDAAPAVEDSSD